MNEQAAKVLVTGAGGFLGSEIVSNFASAGWSVTASTRSTRRPWRLASPAVTARGLNIINLDVIDTVATLAEAIRGVHPDVLINCVGYGIDYRQRDLETAVAVNVLGAAKLVDAAIQAGVGRFIHVGTCAEYGSHAGECDEDAVLKPQGLYGTSKAAGTLLALDRAGRDIEIAVVRPFPLYGPTEPVHKFVPMIIKACVEGATIDLSPGDQLRDYCFVRDAAQCFRMLAECERFPRGQIFNLGSGSRITLKALGTAVANACGGDGSNLNWGGVGYRQDENMVLVPSIDRIVAATGWQAGTPLERGLEITVHEFAVEAV